MYMHIKAGFVYSNPSHTLVKTCLKHVNTEEFTKHTNTNTHRHTPTPKITHKWVRTTHTYTLTDHTHRELYEMEPSGFVHSSHWHMNFHLAFSWLRRSDVGFRKLCWCRYVNVTSCPCMSSRTTSSFTLPQLVYPSGKHGSETVTDGLQLWLPNDISCSPTANLSRSLPVLNVSFKVHALFVNLCSGFSVTQIRLVEPGLVGWDPWRRLNANASFSSSLSTLWRTLSFQLSDGKQGIHNHNVSSMIVSPRLSLHPFFTMSPRSNALCSAGPSSIISLNA